MSDKLNIKNEMRVLDTRDRKWWDTLTEAEQETFGKSMWTQMRWASSVKGSTAAHYLMLVNEFTNVHFNLLKHHPRLQHQLLQLAGTGKTQFHEWIAPGKRGKKNRLLEWLAKEYPQYSDDELELLIQENDPALWKDRMETQGMSKKEIKDMFK
jgi:hypothetical protein